MPSYALSQVFVLIAAWFFDAAVGDPEKLPHPVRAIGSYIRWLENAVPRWLQNKKAAGVCIGILVPATAYFAAFIFIYCAAALHAAIGFVAAVVCLYYCLATRCLALEASSIYNALQQGDIALARQRLARIVGRDTAGLNEREIVRATVETVGENTVDGIISPLFFAALGGAPLAMAFKAVSTLDSMIGYKNEKYRDLGRFSARFDDVLNYIPARLCLLLVPLAALLTSSRQCVAAYRIGRRDSRKSPSPNSGFPEACFAGALGIELGGASSYAGVVMHKPFIGETTREIEIYDIQRAVRLMWMISGLSLLFFMGLLFVVKILRGA